MATPSTSRPRPRLLLASVALLSLAAVGLALVSQHVFGMEPCPWCVLQRVIFLAIALACGLGLLWDSRAGRAVNPSDPPIASPAGSAMCWPVLAKSPDS